MQTNTTQKTPQEDIAQKYKTIQHTHTTKQNQYKNA